MKKIISFFKRKWDLFFSLSGFRCERCKMFLTDTKGVGSRIYCRGCNKVLGEKWSEDNIRRFERRKIHHADWEEEYWDKVWNDIFQLEDVSPFLT